MNIFQIMCASGCGSAPEDWVRGVTNILNLCRFIPLIIVVYAIVVLFKDLSKRKANKRKAYIEFIKRIVFSIVLFLIIIIIGLLITMAIGGNREYDEVYHCWCS